MQESLVKVVLFFTGLFSIAVGVMLLIFPGAVADYTGIASADLGWLRATGAATFGVQGFGLLLATVRRRETNTLVGVISFATTLQTIALWYSLFAGEYGDMARWSLILSAILASVAAVFLWLAWISRRKSVGNLPARGQKAGSGRSGGAQSGGSVGNLEDIPEPDPAPAELLDKIDQESPRFKE